MISMAILLYVIYSVFFPGISYKDKWSEASLIILLRDSALTLDRTGIIYRASFSDSLLGDFLNKTIQKKNLIWWSRTKNAIKSSIVFACNCTESQIGNLTHWFNQLKVNERNISIVFLESSLGNINPQTDGLLIWGYKDLTNYKSQIVDYIKLGKGVVEIMDLPGRPDEVQREVFGIDACSKVLGPTCGWSDALEITFVKPINATVNIYKPYKYFYNFPETIKADSFNDSVPVDSGTSPCPNSDVPTGNFSFHDESYEFWICSLSSVYFDTDRNGNADLIVSPGQEFSLAGYKFYLSYIPTETSIAISYQKIYNFTDFLKPGRTRIYPVDKDLFKILVHRGNYSNGIYPIPAAVVNGRAAWLANFGRDGLATVKDDHKALLLALLLHTSSKEYAAMLTNLRIGYELPYLNVAGRDMYEVYTFNLGFGYPF